jgi:hypothetical protein
MEIIKTPSFEAIDNLTVLIYRDLFGQVDLESIKTSVSNTLVKLGSKSFVSNYNDAIRHKKYDYFTQYLKQ